MPAPRSRWSRRVNAPPTRAAAARTHSSSGARRSSEKGCAACAQPMGEAHDQPLPSMSPIGADGEGDAEHGEHQPVAGAGRAADLHDDGRHARRTPGPPRPPMRRAGRSPRRAVPLPPRRSRSPGRGGRRPRREQDGGQQRRVPADLGGAHELGAADLLVGAGVPDDGEHRHEGGHEDHAERDLERDRARDGVEADRRAGQRDGRRVAADRGPVGGQRLRGVVERLAAERLLGDQRGAGGDPDREAEAVPAQPRTGAAGRCPRSPGGRRSSHRLGSDRVAVAGLGRQFVAVVPEEQLLQRRRRAAQRADAELGQVPQGAAEVVAVDVEPRAAVLLDDVVHAGQRRRGRSPGARSRP